jgi:hypothetical protein
MGFIHIIFGIYGGSEPEAAEVPLQIIRINSALTLPKRINSALTLPKRINSSLLDSNDGD